MIYQGKKVLGGIGVSLTTAAIYVGAAILTLNYLGYESLIPYDILPWFFVFTIFFILMVGSGMAGLGATMSFIPPFTPTMMMIRNHPYPTSLNMHLRAEYPSRNR